MIRVFGLALCGILITAGNGFSQQTRPPFTIEQTVATQEFDGQDVLGPCAGGRDSGSGRI